MGVSLLLCCLVALATGILIFHELNMVTVGFCAILIGLGVDFAILIFGRYQQARDEGADHRARHVRMRLQTSGARFSSARSPPRSDFSRCC